MKTVITRIVPALALWALMFASHASAATKYCYRNTDLWAMGPGGVWVLSQSYDRDHDGYADLRGLATNDARFLREVDGMHCPAGYVEKAGDCNDDVITGPNIHPRRMEIGFNGIDDNCEGSIDEPTMYYAAEGVMNTTSSFRMLVYLNHPDVRAAAVAGNVRADITYVRLGNSANPSSIAKRVVDSFGDAFAYARIDLSGLSAGTVYRSRVKFYRANANGSFTAIGPISPWYYTMTDSEITKVHARFQMVNKGLKEMDDSDRGLVGYLGTLRSDGTRYGADFGEAWCSEFYVWVAQNWLAHIAGISSYAGLRDYFMGYGSFYLPSEIPDRAAPGDYLYLDTNDDGLANHSAMFLAYDTSVNPARVWSLEGNSGNEVQIRTRNADWGVGAATPRFLRLGYITNGMLN